MHEFSSEYQRWFTKQAVRMSGGAVRPGPPTLFDARFPYGDETLFTAPPYSWSAGKFASSVSAATLGRTICHSAAFISFEKPPEPPLSTPPSLIAGYRTQKCWDDVAAMISTDGREPFWRALARAHGEGILSKLGHDRSEELRGRLAQELDPLMKRIRTVLQSGHGIRMTDTAFTELIVKNLAELIYVRQARCMVVQHDLSYAVVPLTDELARGLVISIECYGEHSSHSALVLTA